MTNSIQKASTLVEALPYIKEFYNQPVVIKYGGSAMENETLKEMVMTDIALMKYVGIKPVIIHGGGKHITHISNQLGIETSFLDGYRITDKNTMNTIEMVLSGLLNKDIVSYLNKHDIPAVGISGRDARLIMVEPKGEKYGYVGEVKKVNPMLIKDLEERGYVAVVSPVGTDKEGNAFNINADIAASEVAQSINAKKLLLLTDVDGILKDKDDPKSLISSLTVNHAKKLMKQKVIVAGMIPKIEASIKAIENGVEKVHIINGKIHHSIILEIFTKKGIGTQIIKD